MVAVLMELRRHPLDGQVSVDPVRREIDERRARQEAEGRDQCPQFPEVDVLCAELQPRRIAHQRGLLRRPEDVVILERAIELDIRAARLDDDVPRSDPLRGERKLSRAVRQFELRMVRVETRVREVDLQVLVPEQGFRLHVDVLEGEPAVVKRGRCVRFLRARRSGGCGVEDGEDPVLQLEVRKVQVPVERPVRCVARRTRGLEELGVVPFPVRPLHEMDSRLFDDEVGQRRFLFEEGEGVVLAEDSPRFEEELVPVIDLQRIGGDPGEEVPPERPEPHRAVDVIGERGDENDAYPVAEVVGLRERRKKSDENEPQRRRKTDRLENPPPERLLFGIHDPENLLRMRSTMAVVDRSGTMSILETFPPAFSTTSLPTMSPTFQSAPFTSTSGTIALISSNGVSSEKRTA